MTREEKNKSIEVLTEKLNNSSIFYLTDTQGLDAESTSRLRRLCYTNKIELQIVKNTLLKRAMENANKQYDEMYDSLKGNTSLMIAEVGNAPAKIIKQFRKKQEKPVLKAAYIDEAFFIGDKNLEALSTLKSKEELIGEIIMLLQSPVKNVVSSLQSGKNTLAGLVKTLSERKES